MVMQARISARLGRRERDGIAAAPRGEGAAPKVRQ